MLAFEGLRTPLPNDGFTNNDKEDIFVTFGVPPTTGLALIGATTMPPPSPRRENGKPSLSNTGSARREKEEQLHDTNIFNEAVAAAVSEVRVQQEPQRLIAGLSPAGHETGGADAPAVTKQDQQSANDLRNLDPTMHGRLRPACVWYPNPHYS